jgi:hypothetical protein
MPTDNDGALDVLMTTNAGRPWLFRNEGGNEQSLRVKLVGTKSNRDGIGTIVKVVAGKDQQSHMLRSGSLSVAKRTGFDVWAGLAKES